MAGLALDIDPGSVQLPAGAAPGGLDIDPASVQVPSAAPQPSTLAAVGRGALQGATFNFSDEITGALESLISDKTYQQARDEARANNAAAREAHPVAFGAGEFAGGAASTLVPGLGIAKGAGVGVTAAKAALAGGLQGAGDADASFADTLTSAARGAVAGAGVGAVAHAAGSALSKAAGGLLERTTSDAMGKARPKDVTTLKRLIESDKGSAVEMVHSADFGPAQAAIRKAASTNSIDDARAAADTLDQYIDKVGSGRLEDYAKVDQLAGRGANVGRTVDRFENEVAKLKNTGAPKSEINVLESVRDHVKQTWATADSEVAASALRRSANLGSEALGAQLEKIADQVAATGKTVTGGDVWRAAEAIAKDSGGIVPAPIRKAIERIPFAYEGAANVPTAQLRQVLTDAQKYAVEALGTIAETEHARLRALPAKVFDKALDEHLELARAAHPDAAPVIDRILDRNRKLSLAMSFREGLDQRIAKIDSGKLAPARPPLSDLSKLAAAGVGIGTHSIAGAGALVAAPYALQAGKRAARRGSDYLSQVLYVAGQPGHPGNAFALRQLAAIRSTPAGAAAIANLMTAQQPPAPAAPTQAPAPPAGPALGVPTS